MKRAAFAIFIALLLALAGCGAGASLRQPSGPNDRSEEEIEMPDKLYLTINGHTMSVTLVQNSATEALVALLKEGDIAYEAHGYGGFEMVGALGHPLPRSDAQMTTESGDVVLYSGDQIVLFYGSNTWSYTKLGKVCGVSAEEWKKILTQTDPATVTLSLSAAQSDNFKGPQEEIS